MAESTTGERPSVQRVLEILKEAGEQGERGPEIARRFTAGVLQRRMCLVNAIMNRHQARGYVRRGNAEPSAHYNNVPCYRWYITVEGADYLAGGCRRGLSAARAETRRQDAAERRASRRHQDDLITQAYTGYEPGTAKCVREKAIRELRAAGCTLDAIGGVFGVTRERVRQILADFKCGPCRCPRHGL